MTETIGASPRPTWRERLFNITTMKRLFVLLVALTLLGVGLMQWSILLGAMKTSEPDFFAPTVTVQAQAIILFFAVANLVAAVGLWLEATWGAVIWLSAAAARLVRHTYFASTFGWTPIATGTESFALILFVTFIILERRAQRLEVARQRETRRSRARD